jgi:hypothetical protein
MEDRIGNVDRGLKRRYVGRRPKEYVGGRSIAVRDRAKEGEKW